jgi:hypothetical protein
MRARLQVLVLGTALWAVAAPVPAQQDHDHAQHRAQGAHVHGLGLLDVAQEGSGLYLRLEVPAASIVGFEHAPRGDQERASLEKALETLRAGSALFQLSAAAGCALADATLESPLVQSLAGTDDGDLDHAGDASGHADIAAEYRFDCDRPARLEEIRVTLFERFPALQRLKVQILSEQGQAGAELTPADPVLRP